jgi:hypothetical protein
MSVDPPLDTYSESWTECSAIAIGGDRFGEPLIAPVVANLEMDTRARGGWGINVLEHLQPPKSLIGKGFLRSLPPVIVNKLY